MFKSSVALIEQYIHNLLGQERRKYGIEASIGVLKHMLLHFVLKEQDHPRPLFYLFSKIHTISQQRNLIIDPSSIKHCDTYSQPLGLSLLP